MPNISFLFFCFLVDENSEGFYLTFLLIWILDEVRNAKSFPINQESVDKWS